LKIYTDTLTLNSGIQLINGCLTIKNWSGSELRLPKELGAGYKGDLTNEYYFEILDENKQNIEDFEKIHYVEGINPGPYFILAPGKNHIYRFKNSFYQFSKPGKYYIRVVFANEQSVLEASNYDSITVK
jgi:hypothetical protein